MQCHWADHNHMKKLAVCHGDNSTCYIHPFGDNIVPKFYKLLVVLHPSFQCNICHSCVHICGSYCMTFSGLCSLTGRWAWHIAVLILSYHENVQFAHALPIQYQNNRVLFPSSIKYFARFVFSSSRP